MPPVTYALALTLALALALALGMAGLAIVAGSMALRGRRFRRMAVDLPARG